MKFSKAEKCVPGLFVNLACRQKTKTVLIVIEQVALNKSSLSYKDYLQNTRT